MNSENEEKEDNIFSFRTTASSLAKKNSKLNWDLYWKNPLNLNISVSLRPSPETLRFEGNRWFSSFAIGNETF